MTALEKFLFPVVDEHNDGGGAALQKTAEQQLFGKGAPLDSVALVTFIVSVEQRIEDTAGVALSLADERAMSRSKSPFRTLGTLAEYIDERLAELA